MGLLQRQLGTCACRYPSPSLPEPRRSRGGGRVHAAAPTTWRPLSPDGSEAPPPGGGSACRRSEQEPRPGGSGRSSWCPGRGSAPYSGCPVSRPSGGSAVSPRESWGSARVHCAVQGAGHSAACRLSVPGRGDVCGRLSTPPPGCGLKHGSSRWFVGAARATRTSWAKSEDTDVAEMVTARKRLFLVRITSHSDGGRRDVRCAVHSRV